jgi:hypothetical protein
MGEVTGLPLTTTFVTENPDGLHPVAGTEYVTK